MRASLFSDREAFSSLSLHQPRPLQCQLSCRPCSCSSLAWAIDNGGPYSYWWQRSLCSQKGQNSNVGSLVRWLNLQWGSLVSVQWACASSREFLGQSVTRQQLDHLLVPWDFFFVPLRLRFERKTSVFVSDRNKSDQCPLWFSLKQPLCPWISCCNH